MHSKAQKLRLETLKPGPVDIYTVALVVADGLLFPGIGMVLANFVKEAEGADAAAKQNFPMIFLAEILAT